MGCAERSKHISVATRAHPGCRVPAIPGLGRPGTSLDAERKAFVKKSD